MRSIGEYRELAKQTTREDLKFWDNESEEARIQLMTMCALGLAGELAEYEKTPTIDEAGDVMWYLVILSLTLDLQPLDIMNAKVSRHMPPLQSVCAICEIVKKINFHRKQYQDFDIAELLADVYSYISNRHHISEVMEFNSKKLKARHPDGFS